MEDQVLGLHEVRMEIARSTLASSPAARATPPRVRAGWSQCHDWERISANGVCALSRGVRARWQHQQRRRRQETRTSGEQRSVRDQPPLLVSCGLSPGRAGQCQQCTWVCWSFQLTATSGSTPVPHAHPTSLFRRHRITTDQTVLDPSPPPGEPGLGAAGEADHGDGGRRGWIAFVLLGS